VTHADNTRHLARAAAARHDAADQRARDAIEHLDRDGTAISFTSVAHTAGVSRGWLYQQPDLRDAIINLRTVHRRADSPPTPGAQRATTESLRQRLDAARDEITHLRTDNATLRDQLARSLGQQRAHR
jgi:hypothetical protein